MLLFFNVSVCSIGMLHTCARAGVCAGVCAFFMLRSLGDDISVAGLEIFSSHGSCVVC